MMNKVVYIKSSFRRRSMSLHTVQPIVSRQINTLINIINILPTVVVVINYFTCRRTVIFVRLTEIWRVRWTRCTGRYKGPL